MESTIPQALWFVKRQFYSNRYKMGLFFLKRLFPKIVTFRAEICPQEASHCLSPLIETERISGKKKGSLFFLPRPGMTKRLREQSHVAVLF